MGCHFYFIGEIKYIMLKLKTVKNLTHIVDFTLHNP